MLEGRYWLWVGARLVAGAFIVGMAWWSLTPGGSGEKEFQRAHDALRSVRSWKYTRFAGDPAKIKSYQEGSGEVDCSAGSHTVLHIVSLPDDVSRSEVTMEEIHTPSGNYSRANDGHWVSMKYLSGPAPARDTECRPLALGQRSGTFPDYDYLIHHAVITKGDKKTISGVRCREWIAQVPHGVNSVPDETRVCLGVDDHLPYQERSTWGAELTFRDFNVPIKVDDPEVTSASN